MPKLSELKLNPPENSQEFEEMCCDVLKETYPEKNYVIYGRAGEEQNGIDLHSGKFSIVVQCKNYSEINDFVTKIKEDYENAIKEFEEFKPQEFIVMTSLKRNTKIDKKIAKINGNVPISIWFWEDIRKKLLMNPEIIGFYYSDFPKPTLIFSGEDSKQIKKIQSHLKQLQKGAKSLHSVRSINEDGSIEDDDVGLIYKFCYDMTVHANSLTKILDDEDECMNTLNNKLDDCFSLGEDIENFALPLTLISVPIPEMACDNKKISTITKFFEEYKDEKKYKKFIDEYDYITKMFDTYIKIS